MTEYAYEVPCTFTCEPLLFVLGHMLSRPTTVRAPSARNATNAAHMLATETSRNVEIVDDTFLLVMMDEPFEAVSVARAHGLAPRRCIASALALELVRDDPSTWAWLCRELQLDERRSFHRGIVALPDVDATELPPDVGELPAGRGVWLWMLDPEGEQLVFVDGEQTIGRAGSRTTVDIELRDKRVSRQHATIRPFQGTWAIEDRGSTSGTYLDHTHIRSRCLMPGMVFRLGRSQLVVLSVR